MIQTGRDDISRGHGRFVVVKEPPRHAQYKRRFKYMCIVSGEYGVLLEASKQPFYINLVAVTSL